MRGVDPRYLHSELTAEVLACAFEVHSILGPGLLESSYRKCLAAELSLHGLAFDAERPMAIHYKGSTLDSGYRADLIVEDRVIVELKAIDRFHEIHQAQLLTYLRLSGLRVGLLINFNVNSLKNGIRRFAR